MRTAIYGVFGIVLFLCGIFAVYKANCPQTQRQKQLLLPLVAVIYGVLVVVFFDNIDSTLQKLIFKAAESLSFFSAINTAYLEDCVFNLVILAAFAIIKCIYKLVITLLKRPLEKIFRGAIEYFYEFNDENQHWYLRKNYVGVRRLMRNMYIASIAIALILFICTYAFSNFAAFQNVAYPAFAVLLLGELTFCLSGITAEEYRSDIDFEKDEARRITQYAKLQEVLEHYFKDRKLKAISRGQRKNSAATHADFCEALIGSTDYVEHLCGRYYLSLVEQGALKKNAEAGKFDELNHDAVMASINLMHGKSVMFASPFYSDFTPYIFFPLNSQLIRNKRGLVLFGPQTDESQLLDYINQSLAFVTGFPDMWAIDTVRSDMNEVPDVGLMPFSSLGDVNTILTNKAFFESVTFVIVLEPSSLLATYQIGLNILSDQLTRGSKPVYCIFDKNSDGLVDSLSHALRVNLTEVMATEYSQGSTVGMFWDVDGEFLQHRLFPGVAHYLGVGTEIGLVALKSQIPHVDWAASNSVPLADQRWIDGQYYGELLKFAELPQEQLQLDTHFSFNNDLWSMEKKPHTFVIVEDEYKNMFEMFRQFATRGSSDTFVNVLVPNYLLRQYMVSNAECMAADPKAVPSFAPDFSKGARNVILSLVMIMVQQDNFVAEEDVRSRLAQIGWPVSEGIKSALESLLIEHIAVGDGSGKYAEDHLVVHEEQMYDPLQKKIVTKRFYGLSDASAYADCFKDLKNVPIINEEPDGTKLLLGAKLYGHVFQSYLPGQFVVIQGKYYEVMSISEESGVVLRRAADHFAERVYYRQLRTYNIDCIEASNALGSSKTLSGVRVCVVEATIAVQTQGYLTCSDYGDIVGACKVEMPDIPAREYCHKSMLVLEFPDASDIVISTLAVVLSEFLVTLFPNDYPYISVVVPDSNIKANGVLPGFVGENKLHTLYFVEDSLVDIGLISSLARNISRVLEICWDFLDWHIEMLQQKPQLEFTWEVGECPEFTPPQKRKGLFERIADFFKRHFGSGEKQPPDESEFEFVATDEPKDKESEESAPVTPSEPELNVDEDAEKSAEEVAENE
jgi:hypothetical protein